MLRKIMVIGLFSILGLAALPLAGCQTGGAQPYGVRGTPTAQEQSHYTDDKGRFHQDLWEAGRPLR